MSDNINLQEIRERILSENYGKFDLIEDIISPQEILNLKPRIVLKKITERLSIPLDNINRNTFWSWLRRYKKNYGQLNPGLGITQWKLPRQGISGDEKKTADQDWLQNFEPSIPKSNGARPAVIKVIRSGKNSQQQ